MEDDYILKKFEQMARIIDGNVAFGDRALATYIASDFHASELFLCSYKAVNFNTKSKCYGIEQYD